jgi:hypothetical protein
MRDKILLLLVLGSFAWIHRAFALGGLQYVETTPSESSFPIVQAGSVAGLLIDTNDFSGVMIAANNLRADILRVTDVSPPRLTATPPRQIKLSSARWAKAK